MSSKTDDFITRGCFSFGLGFLPVFAFVLVVSVVKHSGEVGQRFGQQIYSADVIGHALMTYENDHYGDTPPSLGALDINAAVASDESSLTKEDIAQFRLLPPGTRSGSRPVDVVFEAAEENSMPSWASFLNRFPDSTIRIYRDGEVHSEFTKQPQNEAGK